MVMPILEKYRRATMVMPILGNRRRATMVMPIFGKFSSSTMVMHIQEKCSRTTMAMPILEKYSKGNYTTAAKGRSFIVAFTQTVGTPATLTLVLSSYDEPCMVQITVPSPPYNQTVLLVKNSTTEVFLPSNYMLIQGERSRKLVTVSSDADISVIAFNTAYGTADAFACLSKQDLGTEYFLFTSVGWFGNYFAVGNGEDVETQVNITVSGSLLVDGTRYEDKQMVTITLAPQEVILLSDANGLTGTRVVSLTPVAVFSGSICYSSPSSYCDILIEQLYPLHSWGQQFVVFPLMTKEVRDGIIIIAARPNTTVTLRTESTTLKYSLQPGSHISMNLQTGMLVDATEPITVGYLFQGGYTTLGFLTDPFIATVPPSNFSRRYYKFVTNAFFYNYLFIVSRSSSSSSDFLLDYRPLSDNVPTVRHLEGFTGWEVNLGKIGGQHEIFHQTETFAIYVYGVESYISYGYSLGQAELFSDSATLPHQCCNIFSSAIDDRIEFIFAVTIGFEAFHSGLGAVKLRGQNNTSPVNQPYITNIKKKGGLLTSPIKGQGAMNR
ncbi:IgGFc-binding protein-like [Lissotriton helveticus]